MWIDIIGWIFIDVGEFVGCVIDVDYIVFIVEIVFVGIE